MSLTPKQEELLRNDECPDCGGPLDTGYECNRCKRDWLEEAKKAWTPKAAVPPKKIAVLHHADADGFGAAFAAWYGLSLVLPPDQVRPEMKFLPVQYGQDVPFADLHEFAPDEVYILDFSYKRGVLENLQCVYPHLLVVDHHKTAEADLKDLPFCLFDTTHSGCALAWSLFCPDLPMPAILGYVEDRDLWKFELPESKAVNAYIATLEEDFLVWLNFDLNLAIQAGEAALAYQQCLADGFVLDPSTT